MRHGWVDKVTQRVQGENKVLGEELNQIKVTGIDINYGHIVKLFGSRGEGPPP